MRSSSLALRGRATGSAARTALRALCTQASRSLFAVLGVRESFTLDDEHLSTRFKKLQRQWHPDKFHNSPPSQQTRARNMSATLNQAYATLRHPHTRARHLLQLRASDGACADLDGVLLEPSFLTWVMAFREQISDAGTDPLRLQSLSAQLSERLANCLRRLETAFAHNQLADAARHTAELQYYHRMQKAIHDAS